MRITLDSPLDCPGCGSRFEGTWIPGGETSGQACPSCAGRAGGDRCAATVPVVTMLGVADHMVAGQSQVPGVKVLRPHAGGRKDPADLLDLPGTQRRWRTAVEAMSSPVTAHAPSTR